MNEQLLWQKHYKQLKAFIIKQVKDHMLADDILHDVYIKVNEKIQTVENDDSISSWLYRVTRNVIIDHFRKNKHELISEYHEEIENENVSASINQEQMELSKCLLPIINELPEKYREAVYLSEIEGHTQKKVAEIMGQSLSATKSSILRGKIKVREILTRCCSIELDKGNRVSGFEKKCLSKKYC
jgi:RNA polymerase sigma-70 factor (ECF subfamily)